MHPKIDFPGELAPLLEDLARPLHAQSLRDFQRKPNPTAECSLTRGFALHFEDFEDEPHLSEILHDFRTFAAVVMEISEAEDGYPIYLRREKISSRPEAACEAHQITTSPAKCEIVAEDLEGLRRAIFRLEDEMLIRRAPILPLGEETRWTSMKTRISRSPLAPYRWLSGWELEDDNDYYPDAYLNRLAHSGINGLWVPGLLRNLVASRVIPELGPKEHRLEKLRQLVAKAARYGIRIYFFCMEPRAFSAEHPAALAHPEIVGAHHSICTSEPLVRDYIRETMGSLFGEVPDLAGVINIFCGERATNCWLEEEWVQDCPRCRTRSKGEVLAEVLNTFAESIHAANPKAEFMAWAYMMATSTESLPIAPMLEVMKGCRSDVIWLGNFEHGAQKTLCGRDVEIHEYSLSCLGPSENFRDLAKAVRESGRQIYAKLQMGTSFEMSSVPYLPIPGIAYEKIALASQEGATGAMLSWIIGGTPSVMLQTAGESVFEPRPEKDDLLRRMAAIAWGEKAALAVAEAWTCFGEAWQKYPFHNAILYASPITRGPAYQLHLEREPRLAEPYNWGLNRQREPQPFEDQYQRWLGFYTLEEITGSFREMARIWEIGLQKIAAIVAERAGKNELYRQYAVAKAVQIQCLTTANVYEFYALRDQLRSAEPSAQSDIMSRMKNVARNDLQLAKTMIELLAVDPTIGFESEIYAFSYSHPLITEKIIQVEDMLSTLARWQRDGVDKTALEPTETEEVESPVEKGSGPDLWGD